eukprot:COSAG05_NODE_13263_length_436_cov_0.916914_1_plen_104_part_10
MRPLVRGVRPVPVAVAGDFSYGPRRSGVPSGTGDIISRPRRPLITQRLPSFRQEVENTLQQTVSASGLKARVASPVVPTATLGPAAGQETTLTGLYVARLEHA